MSRRSLVRASRATYALVLVTGLVLLAILSIAGPSYPAVLPLDVVYFVLLPGHAANQLLPFARFGGASAIAFVGGCAWSVWMLLALALGSAVGRWRRSR